MSNLPTVIYTHGGGRLGNQVIRLAHWLAWTRSHPGAVNVIDMGFWRYAKYFNHWCDQPGCAFPQTSAIANVFAYLQGLVPERYLFGTERRLQPLVHAAGRHWPGGRTIALNDAKKESYDLADPAFFLDVTSRRLTTCSGWKIAGWSLLAEQQIELREYFRPKARWGKPADNFVVQLRQDHDLIIGVLIRQSDYRSWNGGRFYFRTEQYVRWIRQLLDLHAGRRIAVIVASEVEQDPICFAGLPVFMATGNPGVGGAWFENWVELSLCDIILSAPSTFSATAAWLGAVPLLPVITADQDLAPDQFLRDPLIDASAHPIFSQCVQ